MGPKIPIQLLVLEPQNPAGGCSIYPARALICRFFGFSAMKDKSGEALHPLQMDAFAAGLEDRILVGQARLEKIFGQPRHHDRSLVRGCRDRSRLRGMRLSLHEALASAWPGVPHAEVVAAETAAAEAADADSVCKNLPGY